MNISDKIYVKYYIKQILSLISQYRFIFIRNRFEFMKHYVFTNKNFVNLYLCIRAKTSEDYLLVPYRVTLNSINNNNEKSKDSNSIF